MDGTSPEEIEIANNGPHVYVGLEELDDIIEDEPLFKGAAEIATGERKKNLEKVLAEKEARRQEIFTSLGIKQQLEKYKIEQKFVPKDSKSIAGILISRTAEQLKPVKQGYIRMYRGEGPHSGSTDDRDTGRWFSPEPRIAFSYPVGNLKTCRFLYVDIPKEDTGKYHVDNMPEWQGASRKYEFLLPREVLSGAKEFVRFVAKDTKDNPWPPQSPPINS